MVFCADTLSSTLSLGTHWSPWIVYPLAYFIAVFLSGSIVSQAINSLPEEERPLATGIDPRPGMIIGKCENIITVTCILAGEITGLAIIFAAKSIVRNSKNDQRDDYYLCGTLVNLVWGLMIGFIARAFVS